jgi:hypothetical protein
MFDKPVHEVAKINILVDIVLEQAYIFFTLSSPDGCPAVESHARDPPKDCAIFFRFQLFNLSTTS